MLSLLLVIYAEWRRWRIRRTSFYTVSAPRLVVIGHHNLDVIGERIATYSADY